MTWPKVRVGITETSLSPPELPLPAAGTALASYPLGSSGHVFYIDTSNHLHELWFDLAQGPGWNHADLSASTEAPLPAAGTTLTSYPLGSSGHVFYIDASNRLHELWFDLAQGPGWNHADLSASTEAPLPAAGTTLTSYPLGSSGHVFYIDASNRLHELWFDSAKGQGWHHNDLYCLDRSSSSDGGDRLDQLHLGQLRSLSIHRQSI